MVRALIVSFLLSLSSIAQNSDSVSIFKIRPPEKRIEGLFNSPISEGFLYLTFEGEVYHFPFDKKPNDFYNQLIIEQKDFDYHKGSYFLDRKGEKAVIELPLENNTTFLLGKFRDNMLYMAYSDTMVNSKRWNVGSFLIDKSKEERANRLHQMHVYYYNATSCKEEVFWGGNLDSIIIDVSDSVKFEADKALIASISTNNVESFENDKFRYFTDKYYSYLQSDSQIVIGSLEDSCIYIDSIIGTFGELKTADKYHKNLGVLNYFQPYDSVWVWATKQGCEINLKFYSEETIQEFFDLKGKEFFDRLKKIAPISRSNLNQICGI